MSVHDSESVIGEANAIIRLEREKMKRLLSIQRPADMAPNSSDRVSVSIPLFSKPAENHQQSFDLFRDAIASSLRPHSPAKPQTAAALSTSSSPVQKLRNPPKRASFLSFCTCHLGSGRICLFCDSGRGDERREKVVDIRRALRDVEWRRRVGLSEDLADSKDSAISFWRRALDLKTDTNPCLCCVPFRTVGIYRVTQ